MTLTHRESRRLTKKAIRDGILVRQPCEVCADPDSDGHHVDYDDPLSIRWLCAEHHTEAHGKTWWTPEKIAVQAAWWEEAKKRRVPA